MGFLSAYQGRTVLVTGDSGFKGSWLCLWLQRLGAKVVGYALPPLTDQDNFVACGLSEEIEHIDGDVRDLAKLKAAFRAHQPSIAFHLAAQPLVIASYDDPVDTFSTNVMGTAHFLECVRLTPSVRAAVNITTDKVYENLEQLEGFRTTIGWPSLNALMQSGKMRLSAQSPPPMTLPARAVATRALSASCMNARR